MLSSNSQKVFLRTSVHLDYLKYICTGVLEEHYKQTVNTQKELGWVGACVGGHGTNFFVGDKTKTAQMVYNNSSKYISVASGLHEQIYT